MFFEKKEKQTEINSLFLIFSCFFPPLVLPGRTVGFKRKAQNPPEKRPGFVHYIQSKPGMIVYVWHFSVRKETEKFPRAERVVFYANTVLLYTKRKGKTWFVLPFLFCVFENRLF